MTTTDVSEFAVREQVAKVLLRLDEHRRRQTLAFLAERFGWNLAPSKTRIPDISPPASPTAPPNLQR